MRTVAKGHQFGLLFGGIWALVGTALTLVFGTVSLVVLPMGFGALVGMFFLIAGLAILVWALSGVGRDRALLERGELVMGTIVDKAPDPTYRVNRKPSTRITYGYTDRHGEPHQAVVHLFDRALIDKHHDGQEVPLLVDPEGRFGIMAPTLVGARFAEPVEGPAMDHRRSLGASVAPSGEPGLGHASLPLLPTLDPIEPGLWALLRRPKGPVRDAGLLEVDAMGVRQLEGEEERARVRWNAPFRVGLSAWIVSPTEAELNVTLRPTSASAQERGVRFRVRLPQHAIDASVPVQQELSPFLPAESFERLWPLIVYHAALHGERVAGVRVGDAPERVEVAEVAVVEVARGSS